MAKADRNQRGEDRQLSQAAAFRATLADRLVAEGAVTMPEVAAAVRAVPRHLFTPGLPLARAYANQVVFVKRDAYGVPTSSVSAPDIQAIMLEQAGIRPRCSDPAGCVPTKHPPAPGFGFGTSPYLGVNRIDRDRLYLDQQLTAFRLRLGQVDVDEGGLIGDGSWDLIADGAHFDLRDCC